MEAEARAWKPRRGLSVVEGAAREVVSELMARLRDAKSGHEAVAIARAVRQAVKDREPWLRKVRERQERCKAKRRGMKASEAPKVEPEPPEGLEELLEGLEGDKGLEKGGKP